MKSKEGEKMIQTDVLIIGAGAVGCALARELTKYEVDVLVVDKNEDVGGVASKSNSAIIHTGYDASPGTLESQLVVAANPMYDKLAQDLDVPFQRVGAILPAFSDDQFEQLPFLKLKSLQNNVYDVEYLTPEKLLDLEPNLSPEVKGGLYIPRESIIDPFLLVVAYAENAVENGARFLLGTKVLDMVQEEGTVSRVITTGEEIQAKFVVNAAALYCDEIAKMVGKTDYKINPRKGEFYVLDRNTTVDINHIILPIPTKQTKGKLLAPTIHGNIICGPTADDGEDKLDADTTATGLQSIEEDVKRLVPNIRISDTIKQYSGLRPNCEPAGYHIETYDDLTNYVNVAGVRSTGLTSSASLAKYITEKLKSIGMNSNFNLKFNPIRKGIPVFRDASKSEQEELIKQNPLYGHIICRCETVSEGEIVDAIHRSIPARSVDAIKRRLRPGTGRCQGGFCGPRVIEILAREQNISPEEVMLNQPDRKSVV